MATQLQELTSVASRRQSEPATPRATVAAPRYRLHWPAVGLAALTAATAITVYMMNVPRLLNVEAMDIGITIGSMVDPSAGVLAYLTRIAWHVGHGLIYIPVYAAILVWFRLESNARTGACFGVFLWLAGPMLLIPLLLDRPRINPGDLWHPGVFMLGLGLGWTPALIDLGAHLTHGILAGVLCKHRRTEPTVLAAVVPLEKDGALSPIPEIVSERLIG
ncbi:MAG: hypothetical protein JNM56_34235 [Planctomycetia bacterium]|nr:hypothetical protein [Planctomycetia bacterium]